jgi:hypothetical protein
VVLDWLKARGMLDDDYKPVNTGDMTWKTLEQGAATSIVAAFSPDIVGE